jgi:hypothetical protein
MRESCKEQFDAINCRAATSFCAEVYEKPYRATGMLTFFSQINNSTNTVNCTGRNPYDITQPCEGERAETLCYPVTK